MAKPSKLTAAILTPTQDRRHISKIRFGKISAEVFCRDAKRRKELGLPPRRVESS
jgi:hypothetical protein